MALTPSDIQNQKFETHFRGFDPDAVQDFLDQVATDYNDVLLQNQQLEQSLKESQERVSYFTELKDALNQSIIVAQDAAERVRENAQHEAELTKQEAQKQANELIKEATDRSNQILTEAADRSRQLTVETADLRDSTRVFHQKLQVLLQSQLAMVNAPEWQDLLNQTPNATPEIETRPEAQAQPAAEQATVEEATTTPEIAPVAEAASVEPATETTSESEVEDQPAFQYRNRGNGAQGESVETSTDASQSDDGITIVFPDENK